MILIVTNQQDYTADFLILELRKRQVEYVRFNTEDFPQNIKLAWTLNGERLGGYFSFAKRKVDLNQITSIWYRRPIPPVPSNALDPISHGFVQTESQASLDGVLHCLDCFWVSHPDNIRKAELKLYQLKAASRLGFKVWPTIVTNSPVAAKEFYDRQEGAIVYKPLRCGRVETGEELKLIYTNPVGTAEVEEFWRVSYAPSLFQKYVPKQVEIRATVIGTKVFAVELHSQDCPEALHDWRKGDVEQLHHQSHILPPDMISKCLSLVNSMGLSFGAIDLILTPDGEYVFLEINPNGQWAWIQQLLPDIPLRETLADLLIEGGSQ